MRFEPHRTSRLHRAIWATEFLSLVVVERVLSQSNALKSLLTATLRGEPLTLSAVEEAVDYCGLYRIFVSFLFQGVSDVIPNPQGSVNGGFQRVV